MMTPALPDSRLCDICSHVDFAAYFRDDGGELKGQKRSMGFNIRNDDIPLGTRMEIRSKGSFCPFCDLVDLAIRRTSLTYNEDASIGIKQYYIGENCGNEPGYGIRLVARKRDETARCFSDIKLLAEDAQKLGLSPLFHGREIHERKFDMLMAINWLNICRTRHGTLCDIPGRHPEERIASPQPVELLAIDLEDMCLCNMPSGSEFAALSYCWPATPGLVLKGSNYPDLLKPKSLLRDMHLLPGTVQDAISCAKELSFRYIWIDALCIIQDDDNHKGKQLRQMDRIYGAATLTIVCAYPVAHGTSDDCDGLPGYSNHVWPRRQWIGNIKGLTMMVMTKSVYSVVQDTRWDTRCWTFQEHHLSRRLLYFTHAQVYFQCSCSVFCEDTVCEDARPGAYHAPNSTLWNPKAQYSEIQDEISYGEWRLSRAHVSGEKRKTISYEQALTEFTYREVSFPSDFLNAFEGVMAVLANSMETDFWQGLPEKYLDQTLLWQLTGLFRRRRARPTPGGQSSSKPLFPSWSWAGWDSPVNLHDYMRIAGHRSEVEWFIVRHDGASARLDVIQDKHFHITYSEDGNKDVAPPPANMSEFLPSLLPRSQINNKSKEWQQARTLACYTTRTSFYLDGTVHSLPHRGVWPGATNLTIKDGQGSVTGCILVPPDLAKECLEEPRICHFVLISRSLKMRKEGYRYFDERVFVDRDWCTLNVMLVESSNSWEEVRRVGVGIVHEDAWVRADPKGVVVRLV